MERTYDYDSIIKNKNQPILLKDKCAKKRTLDRGIKIILTTKYYQAEESNMYGTGTKNLFNLVL